jgi:predicted choloylglycine hydrolase
VTLTFRAVAEPWPGDAWRARFEALWPAYRAWFLRDGDAARPPYPVVRRMLDTHMPELVPVWERLVELAGGGDLAARMLGLYGPPPLVSACSQAAVAGPPPLLVRNYDFDPAKLECTVLSTAYTERRVIGMSDCLWGLLDGINDAGLAVSLAFGGRREVGDGFGIALVIRYLLETCEITAHARRALTRLPIQAAYNLTLADAGGDAVTAFVGPDRAPQFERPAAATNHQEPDGWPEHELATRSIERHDRLLELLANPDEERLTGAFLRPPLYSTQYGNGFGTLYTAVYRPAQRAAEYRWPGVSWPQSFDAFEEGARTVTPAPR